jgi:DNA-binding FadR family transcriptional regulator
VREAVKVLEFMGIAERITGKGVFLRKMRMENIVSNLDFMQMTSQKNLLDLFEARLGIEVLAARLAAMRRTGQDLEHIGQTLKILGDLMEEGASTLGASLDFHAAVIAASHNSVLIEMNLYLADQLRMAREHFRELKSPHGHGIAGHEGIYRAIEAMDADAAAECTRAHLTRPIDTLRQAIASTTDRENSRGEPLSG